jgi:hypothetical protein
MVATGVWPTCIRTDKQKDRQLMVATNRGTRTVSMNMTASSHVEHFCSAMLGALEFLGMQRRGKCLKASTPAGGIELCARHADGLDRQTDTPVAQPPNFFRASSCGLTGQVNCRL